VEPVQKGDKVYYDWNETYYLELPEFKGAVIKENQIAFKYIPEEEVVDDKILSVEHGGNTYHMRKSEWNKLNEFKNGS
jgi:hypothetical protein